MIIINIHKSYYIFYCLRLSANKMTLLFASLLFLLRLSYFLIFLFLTIMKKEKQSHNNQPSNISITIKYDIEHRVFEVAIKKQSMFLSNWKRKKITMTESPHQELMMTVKNNNQTRISEVINITHSKLSNGFTKIDRNHCFGVIIPSSRKYYLSCRTLQDTTYLYSLIYKLKRQIRAKKQSQINNKSVQYPLPKEEIKIVINEYRPQPLNSPKNQRNSNENIKFESLKSYENNYATGSTKTQKGVQLQDSFVSAIEDIQQHSLLRSSVHMEAFKKIKIKEQIKQLQRSKLNNQHQYQSIIQPLVILQPITFQEIQCLQTDEGFKLLQNFNNGRLLVKAQKFIKASLITVTQFSTKKILQSFFHFQLWNQRVKKFNIVTRIEKGILLVQLQFHRRSFFSLPKYCYMMVTTCKVKGQYVVVFRSLQKQNYEQQFGYSWIKMNIWAKVASSKLHNKKIIQICGSFQTVDDYEQGLSIFQQIKSFQIFLQTTGKLPKAILQWNGQINEIDDQI